MKLLSFIFIVTWQMSGSSALFGMVSTDGAVWHPRAVVPAGPGCPDLDENDWTYQSDGTTMLAVLRNSGPAGVLCSSRSSTEGHMWSGAKPLALPRPNNVLPRLACLANGLITLSTGRIGLFLYIKQGQY